MMTRKDVRNTEPIDAKYTIGSFAIKWVCSEHSISLITN